VPPAGAGGNRKQLINRRGPWREDRNGTEGSSGPTPARTPSRLRALECSCSSDPSTSPSSDHQRPPPPQGMVEGLESGVAEAGALEGAGGFRFRFRGASTGRATDSAARLVRRCTDGLPCLLHQGPRGRAANRVGQRSRGGWTASSGRRFRSASRDRCNPRDSRKPRKQFVLRVLSIPRRHSATESFPVRVGISTRSQCGPGEPA
jgi:hypothetical protein